MKNFKLNLKGLYGYSQSLSPRTLQPSDEREMSERQPREERTLLLLTRRIWKYAAMVVLMLTLGVGNAWGWNSYFTLGGTPVGSTWTSDDTYRIQAEGDNGQGYIDVYMETNETFCLYKKDGNAQYGPNNADDQNTDRRIGDAAASGYYKRSCWVYKSDNQLVRVNINRKANSNEYYPSLWLTKVWDPKDDINAVLTGSKVMYYYGDVFNESHGWKYLYNGSGHNSQAWYWLSCRKVNGVSTDGGSGSWDNFAWAAASTSQTRYYVSNNNGWDGIQMPEGHPQAGCSYMLYNSDGNKLKVGDNCSSATFTNSGVYNIEYGTANSGVSASCTKNSSAIGKTNSIYGYYISSDGGTTWSNFDPAHAESLIPSTYKIAAIVTDGVIYVKTEATLTVNETKYTITVNSGENGIVSPASVEAGAYTKPSISATPNNGYYFTNWSQTGGANVTSSSLASTTVSASATGSVTANFAPTWAILGSQASNTSTGTDGFGGWSTSNTNNLIANYTDNVGYVDVTLEANKQYQFKMYERNSSGGTFYGNNTSVQYMQYTPADKHTDWTFETNKSNCGITTAGAGTYRFSWNQSTKKLTVNYPTSYTVTFGYGTGGSSVTATVQDATTITTGQYAAGGKNVTFTQTPLTGYTFKGWYTAASGGSVVTGMTTSDNVLDAIGANANVYAQYTANTYKITFDATTNGGSISNNGTSYEEGGARKITATYDVTVSGTMPTARKNGYYFKGWYTASSGGNCVINADGTWNEVTGYTNSSKQWKNAANTTLYAQYGTPVFSSVAFTPASVLPMAEVTVTPTFDHNPEGTYTLCYVLTTGSAIEMEVQPTFTAGDGLAVRFEAPASPGTYSVDIRLFSGAEHDCANRGTDLVSTYDHATSFTVEASNTVTVQYKCGDVELRPSTTVYASADQTAATVTAPEIPGLTFSDWTLGSNVSLASGATTDNPISIHASAAGTLTANYSQSGYVYFKNTLGWDNVYFYRYEDREYWGTDESGNYGIGNHKNNDWAHYCLEGPVEMTKVAGTDDLYCCKPSSTPQSGQAYAFTDKPSTEDFFGKSSEFSPINVLLINNGSFNSNNSNFSTTNHMIVPDADETPSSKYSGRVQYYGNYIGAPSLMDWGWTLRGDWDWETSSAFFHLTASKMGSLSFQTKRYFDTAGSTTYIAFFNPSSTRYGHYGGQINGENTEISISQGNDMNIGITPNIPGEYIFTVTYSPSTNQKGNSSTANFPDNINLTVTYPVVEGDFRLVYTGGTKPHPGNVVKKRANGVDVVDMYVAAGQSGSLKVQPCTAVSASSVTWKALNSCSAPTYAEGVNFASILSTGGAGVYSFTIEQDKNGENPKITKVEKYAGQFYVRTDCVNDDKWNYKDSKAEHAMTYSDYSTTLTEKPFSHYFVKDIHANEEGYPASVNIRFTVATENSEAITDTVTAGEESGDYQDIYHNENLNLTANVRFTYNQATNKIWRAYTEGPSNNDYMRLKSNGSNIYEANADGTRGNLNGDIKFGDRNNWVYQLDVYANTGAFVKLTAEMHDHEGTAHTQYLKGIDGNGTDNIQWTNDDAVKVLSSTGGASIQRMRITYDFKTDRMITAWLPSGTIATETTMNIDADVLLIRKHQLAGQSITIEGTGKLTSINTVYGVMQFEKDSLNDVAKSVYSRDLYWISFPFDVKLSDVFGFGTYGKHWIIEYYDGQERARKGYWADSPGFWKFVMPAERANYTLKANQGYVLALDLDELGTESSVWGNNVTTLYLYFPSATEIGNLELVADPDPVTIDQEGYRCTIDRTGLNGAGADINKNRTVADSYWHIIGAPSYANAGRTDIGTSMPELDITDDVPYIYEWNPTTNLYTVHSTADFTFDALRGYMTQYNGTSITWTSVTAQSNIVARRQNKADIHAAEFRLELKRGETHCDQTYVRLSDDEDVTVNFDFNRDMCKEFNAGNADIYTIIQNYLPAAGNSLPLSTTETTIVPVGVKIASAGEYTFAMPDGTNGVGVTLIDNETGSRTSLSALNYTVALTAGEYTNRFVLEISPVQNTPTDIENEEIINRKSSNRKLLIDGILYIVRDGKMYDVHGARVK